MQGVDITSRLLLRIHIEKTMYFEEFGSHINFAYVA